MTVAFEPRPRRRGSSRLVVTVTLAIFAAPFLYLTARREVSRWCEAIAVDASLNEDIDRAIAWGHRGLRFEPDNTSLRSLLSSWKTADGDANDALQDANAALEIARQRFERMPSRETGAALAIALNRAAYIRALAEKEIAIAKSQIDEAFELLPPVDDIAYANHLDTRGFIRHLLGEHEEAHADMEMAVQLFEHSGDLLRADIRRQSQLAIDQRPFQEAERGIDHTAAVLYQHRGLTYEALGQLEEAHSDFRRAKEWGYDPQQGVW